MSIWAKKSPGNQQLWLISIEYSVPGNIHYGFVAREAGYPRNAILYAAAGAERGDPVYDPASPFYGGKPFDPEYMHGRNVIRQQTPWGVTIYNYGDNPQDNIAVAFGIYLYDTYGRALTRSTFQTALAMVLPTLAHHPVTRTVKPSTAAQWPYAVDYFTP